MLVMNCDEGGSHDAEQCIFLDELAFDVGGHLVHIFDSSAFQV